MNFTGYEVESFFTKFGVNHRVSSAMYPRSNMRAELGVQSMKRLCRDNTTECGSLDTDRFVRAILSYRNTPDRDTGRSPSEVLFGRTLRHHLPGTVQSYSPRKE